ncbi:MAG: zf-HC2 domain-containing protein [Acidimicrobiales bacterium]
MTCSEDRLVAFLAGEVSEDESRRFDEHLLSCEACWRAVQEDRAARLALRRLHESAPPGLADRIALALEISTEESAIAAQRPFETTREMDGRRWESKRTSKVIRRRFVAAAIGSIAAAGLAVGLAFSLGPSEVMPAQLAAVVAVAKPMSAASAAPNVREVVVGGETMRVRFFVVDHMLVTVATATKPFPMAPPSDLERGSTSGSWMASMSGLGAFCVNRAGGEESMLVVAKMPAAALPAVALRLRLM